MTDPRALTYVEVDVDFCSHTYGVAPCTAALGVTGDRKCFNSLATCQDRVNFANAPVTIRFAVATEYLPQAIDAIASITGVSLSPTIISLGENLGQRASLSVTFKDHAWSDTGPGYDKYYASRAYDPFRQGTYWGKFRARQPFLRGRPLRLIRGFVGQALADMETRHFIIESFDGPARDGSYTIVAKDPLKLADGDRAQAPVLSNGFLVAAITSAATSATLSPAGIGNAEYPASGYVAIGGKEVCAFTRAADVLTLTRAQYGTAAQAHDGQDRVQLCVIYSAQDPANIIADLLETYAGFDAGQIPLSSWQLETSSYYRRLLSAAIAEPTAVDKLLSELIEQAGLALWWDDLAQLVRLKVLRGIDTNADRYDEDVILAGSFAAREQPEKRLSQVWTYFGQRNPLDRQEDPDNYRSVAATVELQSESDYGAAAIRKIYSRWIPAFGRTIATRLNDILLGRFVDAPRRFNFSLMRPSAAELGGGYKLGFWTLQDDQGAPVDVPVQVTRLNPEADRLELEAEEMLFVNLDPVDLSNRFIVIDSDTLNFNLRTVHDSLYPAPVSGDTVTCIVDGNVTVGSSILGTAAFDVGSWPAGVTLNLTVLGRIAGRGGKGGDGWELVNHAILDGQPGGTGIYTRYAIAVTGAGGKVRGGGGGGGAARYLSAGGGGGGAGRQVGAGGLAHNAGSGWAYDGAAGTDDAGGLGGLGNGAPGPGYAGGNGGAPGAAGTAGAGIAPVGAGGAAGKAVDGESYVTWISLPTFMGARVN